MASGSKSNSVFTTNDMGKGPSSGITNKDVGNGQTLKSAYPQDNVHGYAVEDLRGGSFAGGDKNLAHSLTGASAVQDGPGAAGPVKHVRIRGGH